jgi:hypothetical protein
LQGLLLLSSIVLAGLVAGVIVLGVRDHGTRRQLRDLRKGNHQSSQGALITKSNVAPEGFESQGALGAGSGTWALKSQFPGPAAAGISDGSAVTVREKVYHVGGHIGNANAGNQVINATYIYDPLSDTFELGPVLPLPVARGGAAFDGEGTLYYAGGVSRQGGESAGVFGGPGTPCLYSLDVSVAANASTQWKQLPCMPTPRSDFCAVCAPVLACLCMSIACSGAQHTSHAHSWHVDVAVWLQVPMP